MESRTLQSREGRSVYGDSRPKEACTICALERVYHERLETLEALQVMVGRINVGASTSGRR